MVYHEQVRPAGVPEEAWWSEDDREWVLGDRDAAGKLSGLVRYWRPDGTLVAECPHVAGVPHGEARRFHESGEPAQIANYATGQLHGRRTWLATTSPTTEQMHVGRMSKKIVRAEVDYDRGQAIAFRYFDADGRSVAIDGAPLQDRPQGVPPEAMHERGEWVAGRFTEHGAPIGRIRRWSTHGGLIGEEDHEDGLVRATSFYPAGGPRTRFALRGGKLDGLAETWRRDGTIARRATFAAGSYAGPSYDFARDGAMVRRVEPGPPRLEASGPAPLPAADSTVLEGIGGPSLSPVGMAYAIARGWGGDEDRDAARARRHRALALRLAPPSLARRFTDHGLEQAPRIMTAARLQTISRALAEDPAVDGVTLAALLADSGATGFALGLSTTAADRLLHGRIRDGRLALSHLGLEQLPAAIGRFPGLREIDASYNQLADLPVEVAEVFRLQRLDLTHNRIASLPRELAWLPELRTIYLASNKLTQIPRAVFDLEGLTTLTVGDNPLTELPDAIGDLAGLRTLQLYETQLADLPPGLVRLGELSELHLGAHGWAEPPAVLGELAALESLWIASKSLKVLPPAICKLPRLRRLIVWYSDLTSLPDELFECTQLVELRVRDNPLPEGTIDRLRAALPTTTIY